MAVTPAAERRQFFRVEDEVYLRYRVVSEDERLRVAHEIRAGVKSAGQLLHDLENNQELSALRVAAAKTDSAIADYLQVLEQKLVDLTRVVAGDTALAGEMHYCQVSLSGGGVAFVATEALPLTTELEIWLSLPPGNRGVRALAKVAEVGPGHDGYRVAAEFAVIDGADRDLVVAWVLARQAEALRQARAGENEPD